MPQRETGERQHDLIMELATLRERNDQTYAEITDLVTQARTQLARAWATLIGIDPPVQI